MSITLRESNFKTLRHGDFGFNMKDGIVIAPRAGFEFSATCPHEYKQIIVECIKRGWLKPVATVRDYELTREALCD